MKKKSLWWLRFTSAIIDVSVIYSISILLQALIWKFTFIGFPIIFIAVFVIYYFVSYEFLKGKTFAKMLTRIKIVTSDGGDVHPGHLLLREVILKGGIGILFPIYILKTFFQVWWPLLTPIVLTLLLFLSFVFLLVFRSTWWESVSKTRSIKEGLTQKTNLIFSLASISVLIVSAIGMIIYPFLSGKENIKTSFYPNYPVTDETIKYADFIKANTKDPVDYIFDLFRQYDMVVISERMHPEYTQYDLISKIVSDERFIKEVGNIFTECGSISFQDSLNTLLATSFETEDKLNRQTAILQRNSNAIWPLWSNTNLFDLLKTVNKLNRQLPDSAKINWHFTDLPVDWRIMTHEKFNKAYRNAGRDSIMAANVIRPYKDVISNQRRHKALVIMNTRHGYGLFDQRFSRKIRNEYNIGTTAFLMRHLPGKVANIMMNTVSLKYGYMFTPVQNGKWETAFSIAGNQDTGFNFAGNPLGDDEFDVAPFASPAITYKDVFTGFIFYKPLKDHFDKDGFPHEFDNFEDTILRRSSYVSSSHVDILRNQIARYKEHPKEPVFAETQRYAVLHNLVNVIIIPVLLFMSLLVSLLFFIFRDHQ